MGLTYNLDFNKGIYIYIIYIFLLYTILLLFGFWNVLQMLVCQQGLRHQLGATGRWWNLWKMGPYGGSLGHWWHILEGSSPPPLTPPPPLRPWGEHLTHMLPALICCLTSGAKASGEKRPADHGLEFPEPSSTIHLSSERMILGILLSGMES